MNGQPRQTIQQDILGAGTSPLGAELMQLPLAELMQLQLAELMQLQLAELVQLMQMELIQLQLVAAESQAHPTLERNDAAGGRLIERHSADQLTPPTIPMSVSANG